MDKLSTDGNKAKDSVIIFDGKDPNRAAKWFELSQATERFAEYHCGTPGVEIWLGVSPVLTEENVTDAAEDALAFIRVYHGIREGESSAKDDDFWQIPFQNEFRGKLRRKLYMFLHDHSSGRFRAWLDDFDSKSVDNIRDAGMKEYGQVNRGTIQMWENEFRMGMPIKTGQPAFHRGCDFSAIKARLKKRQSLLHHMCPLKMRDEYEFGNWNGDYARLQVYLVHGHAYRAVINDCVKQAQQSARNAGVLDVSANVNDPDYENKWSPYLTVYMVEEAIEADFNISDIDSD